MHSGSWTRGRGVGMQTGRLREKASIFGARASFHGGGSRQDAAWVMQDYNILGRTIEKGEGFFNFISNAFKDIVAKFKKDKEEKEHLEEANKQEMPKELETAKEEITKK